MVSVTRNELCPCKSGLKYKYCHYEIDTAKVELRLTAARSVYNENWKANADNFKSQGCYDWMASLLKPYNPKRVFDVGCGEGSGLLSLLKLHGEPVTDLISIDENPECIRSAALNLAAHGYSPGLIYRYHVEVTSPHSHRLHIYPDRIKHTTGVMLIESDIQADREIFSFLSAEPKFDAVTVWLIGSHQLRQECDNLAPSNIKSSGEYRLRVQNEAYRLADSILRVGGVLQVVDRGERHTTGELRQDALNAHHEQASNTTLEVTQIESMEYIESAKARAIKMSPTLGTSGRMGDFSKLAIHSIISVKR